jgi:hypothetical protein
MKFIKLAFQTWGGETHDIMINPEHITAILYSKRAVKNGKYREYRSKKKFFEPQIVQKLEECDYVPNASIQTLGGQCYELTITVEELLVLINKKV